MFCAALIALMSAHGSLCYVEALQHDLGLSHPFNPLAGAAAPDHVIDHADRGEAPDPHSDYDGPPLPSAASDTGGAHHHNNFDHAPAVIITPPTISRVEPVLSTAWHIPTTPPPGLRGSESDHPPRPLQVQLA